MSLVTWLPLNGDILDRGVAPTTFKNGGATLQTSIGVLGQSYYLENKTLSNSNYTALKDATDFSACCWAKFTGFPSTNAYCISLNTSASTDQKFILGIGTSSGKTQFRLNTGNSVGTLSLNTWYHLAVCVSGTTGYMYLNGELVKTVKDLSIKHEAKNLVIGGRSTNAAGTSFNGTGAPAYYNDIRIYNHCLSPREVKLIAQGLILHMPLKDGNMEPTTNLLPYPTPGNAYSPAWDANLHPGAISVSGWNNTYNGGVASPELGYHAYWKLIDGMPTMVFPDQNDALGLGHRWLGISASGLQTKIGPSTTYTLSFDAKASVDGLSISSGYRYRSNGTDNFHDSKKQAILTTTWKRYSFTWTTLSTLDTSANAAFYVYGHEYNSGNKVSGISYVRNLQVELKDHATPYTPSSRVATVMDCSGHGYHGTTVGTIKTLNDSARYGQCLYQEDARTNYVKSGTFIMPTEQVTMSCWFKSSTTGYSSYHIPLSFNADNYEISVDASGKLRNGFRINGTRSALTTTHSGSILDGKWHMLTATYDGTTIKRYLDGVELTANATTVSGPLVGGSASLLVGNYNGTNYGNKQAYTSDVRVYGTALSAAAIKTLYESRIAMTADNDFMAYEFIEDSPANIKFTASGLARSGGISETVPTYGMPIKSLSDGSVWARIYWLDLTSDKTLFASAAEVDECLNKANRYSRLGIVDRLIGKRFNITNLMPAISADNYSGGEISSSYKKYGSNSIKVTGVDTSNEAFINTVNAITYVPGHTYYCRCDILQETVQGSCDMYWKVAEPYLMGGKKATTAKEWATASSVRTADTIINRHGADWEAGDYKARWDYNNSKTAGEMWFNGFMLIDLTETFGVGKEPTAAWCDEHIPYFTGSKIVEINEENVGWYEFMLTYPKLSTTAYNRWKQISSPNDPYGTAAGQVKITTSWSKHSGPLATVTGTYKTSSVYACNTAGNWWAPVGQLALYSSTGIPAADGSTQTETELWVRIDTLPSEKRISMFDNKFIQALNIYEL